ncbi:MAG TPA: cell division protein SepF [Bacilli bacterium]|nr:cell division protein SepF [Bacilli bacterium]
MAFDKLKQFITDDYDESKGKKEDQYYDSKEAFKDSSASAKMMLLEPRAFSEAQTIANYLKSRMSVVVNMRRVTPDQAKRIIDFLSGSLYAIGGNLQKLGNGIFLCTPNNFAVEGKISEESKDTKTTKVKKDTNDEFDW